MVATTEILTLPPEPPVGAIVEILDGNNQGHRYRRESPNPEGWRLVIPPGLERDLCTWSEVWWAVVEDGGGGSKVRVTIPDPDDPHPLPWRADHPAGLIWDGNGCPIPLGMVADRVNTLGRV